MKLCLPCKQSPRPGEADGVDYHFVSRAEIEDLREAGGMVETAEFSGNLYGTSVEAVKRVREEGQ